MVSASSSQSGLVSTAAILTNALDTLYHESYQDVSIPIPSETYTPMDIDTVLCAANEHTSRDTSSVLYSAVTPISEDMDTVLSCVQSIQGDEDEVEQNTASTEQHETGRSRVDNINGSKKICEEMLKALRENEDAEKLHRWSEQTSDVIRRSFASKSACNKCFH